MGIRLNHLLELPPLQDTEILAGAQGMNNEIQRVTVLESPDTEDWLTGGELVLSNTFLFQAQPGSDARLVKGLVSHGATALGIKLGRYVDSLSREALKAADEESFPILRLPYEVAWADVINVVLSELLNEKTALLERSENIHTQFTVCVLQGKGLDGIAWTLNNLTGMPLIITDRNLETLAAAGSEAATAALVDQTEVLLELAREDKMLNVLSGISENSIRRTVIGDRAHLVVPIRVHGRREGYILLAERQGKPLSRSDIVAVQHARTVASLEFLKRRAVREVERRFGSDFVLDLISGRFDSVEAMKRRASFFNLDLSHPQVLLLAELDDQVRTGPARTGSHGSPEAADGEDWTQTARDTFATSVNQALRKGGRGGTAVPVGNSLIVLLPVRQGCGRDEARKLATQAAEGIIAEVAAELHGAAVSVGVGRFEPAIERLPEAYRQAREALDIGCAVWGPGRVFHFDDLGIFRLLANGDRSEAAEFVKDVLGPLAEHDARHGSQFVETLQAFLEANGNLSQAARRLVVHVNTLKYRLGKIEGVTGRSFDDPDVRLNAQIALRMAKAFPSLLKSGQA